MFSLSTLDNIETFMLELNNYSLTYSKESNSLSLESANNLIKQSDVFAAAFNYFLSLESMDLNLKNNKLT
jgi:hypothetical protein